MLWPSTNAAWVQFPAMAHEMAHGHYIRQVSFVWIVGFSSLSEIPEMSQPTTIIFDKFVLRLAFQLLQNKQKFELFWYCVSVVVLPSDDVVSED